MSRHQRERAQRASTSIKPEGTGGGIRGGGGRGPLPCGPVVRTKWRNGAPGWRGRPARSCWASRADPRRFVRAQVPRGGACTRTTSPPRPDRLEGEESSAAGGGGNRSRTCSTRPWTISSRARHRESRRCVTMLKPSQQMAATVRQSDGSVPRVRVGLFVSTLAEDGSRRVGSALSCSPTPKQSFLLTCYTPSGRATQFTGHTHQGPAGNDDDRRPGLRRSEPDKDSRCRHQTAANAEAVGVGRTAIR